MVLHILHAGHAHQGWVPAVHGLQFHVDQEAVWGALQGDNSLQAKAQLSGAEAPRREPKCCALQIVACQRGSTPFGWLSAPCLPRGQLWEQRELTHHLEGPGGHSRGPGFFQIFLPTEAIRVWVVWKRG